MEPDARTSKTLINFIEVDNSLNSEINSDSEK